MKTKFRFFRWLMLLMLSMSVLGAWAQVGGLTQTGNMTVCLNSTESYGVMPTVGSTYTWSILAGTGGAGTITNGPVPNNLISIHWTNIGTCTLQVTETNSSGCSEIINAILITVSPLPTLTITNPAAVCSPNTVNLTAAAVTTGSTAGLTFTYWTDAAATLPYTTQTAATAGTYYIKGTTAAGCSDIKPVTVTVNPLPTVTITNPAAVCSPNTVDLSAAAVTVGSTAGLTFTYWTDAAATVPYTTQTAATAGTYYIKGTTAAGCSDIKPVTVTVNPLPTVTITNPAAVCSPNTVNLTAAAVTVGSTAGLTFTYWTDAAATVPYTTQTAATAGTYYIKGTTAAGCSDIKPVTVTVNPLPATSPIYHN